ncbi:MAG: lysozyme inhibitor LprI family protein [Methylobacter sp.]|uniref:lysozyme inhibitor LprI family protein n=1 Tax=Methylobacter sp. TaxID=2051955 RepID=UPI00272F5ECB|nr:lysozyme inhibitor LprI family protein [Methylobacter sp.]MDP1665473.1 lysozyme inhibitor LprI family protein [Methylobacter sp.]
MGRREMMQSFKYVVIAAMITAGIQPVFADDNGLSQTFLACMDQSGGVTVSMIECMNAEAERQDVRLNNAYKDIMSGLSPERKKQLQEAQRLWLKYRTANCDFYYDPDGGTIAGVSANDCFMSATAARAKELESIKQQD